jgi:hypothetical protein
MALLCLTAAQILDNRCPQVPFGFTEGLGKPERVGIAGVCGGFGCGFYLTRQGAFFWSKRHNRYNDLKSIFELWQLTLFGQARHPKTLEEVFLLGNKRSIGRTCRRP